ncbi:type VII secretion system-associated protein [Streptomyces sp. NPDC006654]|uniref:type VII secretion system-associated protein n=1 Tax=Streptomyces sp. NPDC006654 TaxID=3156897 RepID=UPI0033E2F920
MTDLTKLNAPALQAFIDHDVAQFARDISDLRTSNDSRRSLYDTANASDVFVLGNLAGDSDTAAKNVVTNTVAAAKAIDGVLNRHSTAFADLDRNLRSVITTMLKTQGKSLQDVDGQKFLTAIKDYDGDMYGSGGGAAGASSSS